MSLTLALYLAACRSFWASECAIFGGSVAGKADRFWGPGPRAPVFLGPDELAGPGGPAGGAREAAKMSPPERFQRGPAGADNGVAQRGLAANPLPVTVARVWC